MNTHLMIPSIVWPHKPDIALSTSCALSVIAPLLLMGGWWLRRHRVTRAMLQRLGQMESMLQRIQDGMAAQVAPATMASPASPSPTMVGGSNVELAVSMARCGAHRQELVRTCGLTQQEAELVARLHGPADLSIRGAQAA